MHSAFPESDFDSQQLVRIIAYAADVRINGIDLETGWFDMLS